MSLRSVSDGVSIIIPFHNNASTLALTLSSLEKQVIDIPVEILPVNAESDDDSARVAAEHPIGKRWPVRIMQGRKGLAYNYNLGATEARYATIVNMHADCYVESCSALADIIRPLGSHEVVAVTPNVWLPAGVWDQMPFWDKAANARFVGKFSQGLTGKFNAIKHSVLTGLGGFDSRHFFSAGEDVDMHFRLSQVGGIFHSEIEVIHAHHYAGQSSILALLRKQLQLGLGTGAAIRKQWRWSRWKQFTGWFFSHAPKLALCICAFIPIVSLYALGLLFLLGIIYSWRVFRLRDIRIFAVPFVNIMMFYCFSAGLITGWLSGYQRFH